MGKVICQKGKKTYNFQNNHAPEYFCKLIPPNIPSRTLYPLRNGNDIIVPFCRLSLTAGSYIPKWNDLDPSIRNVESNSKFEQNLKRVNTHVRFVPKCYA